MIIDRFRSTYHAEVTDFGKPLLWEYVKVLQKDTNAKKIIDVINEIPLGAEFDIKDIYGKALNGDKKAFEKAKSKSHLLKEYFARSKKSKARDGKYIKRFKLKDIDSYIIEHPEPEYDS